MVGRLFCDFLLSLGDFFTKTSGHPGDGGGENLKEFKGQLCFVETVETIP
jgi:hypothetical protein